VTIAKDAPATPLLPHSVELTGEAPVRHRYSGAKVWLLSSMVWLTFVDLVGLVLAIQLTNPEFLSGIEYLLFSRIRPIHVNGVIFAWLSMMYWGAAFYMLPRLLGLGSMWSERLAVVCGWLFNAVLAVGFVTLSMGYTQGREYMEFIWPVDIALLVVWLLNVFNVLMTVLHRRVRSLYVASWWFIAAPIWLAADYAIGNVIWRPGTLLGNGIPGAELSGAMTNPMADAMLNWWANHNLFGLWLTPMLVALTYYLVPRITNTPLYSHTLSLVSFWGIAFFYTGVGHHHLLQAPIPGWLKTFATVNSILLLVPVFAFVVNITLTMRGNWEKVFTNMPLRFTITGFVFYFLVNIQGSIMAVPAFNRLIHFTNFIVAHAHLALLGAFTILGMGVIDYIVSQIYARPAYSRKLLEWQYWLVTIGFVGFFFSLTFASFLQGQNWAIGVPEVNVLPQLQPHYIARGAFGAMVVASGIVQIVNIVATIRRDTRRDRRTGMTSYLGSTRTEEVTS